MDPITLTGLAFTGVTVLALGALHGGRVEVPRLGRWATPPRVLVSARSTVTVPEVDAAVAELAKIGGRVEGVELVGALVEPVRGAILIRRLEGRPVDPGHAGQTTYRVGPSGFFEHATIDLPLLDFVPVELADGDEHRPYTTEERRLVLAHELAHALGWGHCSTALFGRTRRGAPRLGLVGRKSGHLMHPHLDGLGWNTRGMEAR